MAKILLKQNIAPNIFRIDLEAPKVARSAKAGQFVMVRIDEFGERIPLTINSSDTKNGLITLIFQIAGTTTHKLALLNKGDSILDLLGPLGKPTDFGKAGKVVIVAGGVGIAEALPIARYAKNAGNEVISIIGGRSKEYIILEAEMRDASEKLFVTTDDGSAGKRGFVTEALAELLKSGKFDLCYSVGPDIMMKSVSEFTKTYNLKTIVSLDANMVDATGMCGTCRVTVGGKVKFTCVDGPEFDGHAVDWNEFMMRQARFRDEERISFERFKKNHPECMYKVK